MKVYKQTINKINFMYFFDAHIKSWTVMQLDIYGNQIGFTEYFANKQSLLSNYKFNFTK